MVKEDKLLSDYIKYFGDKPPLPPRHIMESLVKMKEEGNFDEVMGKILPDMDSIKQRIKDSIKTEVTPDSPIFDKDISREPDKKDNMSETNNILYDLEKAYYVRSKISNYPLCQPIKPAPAGVSVVIFENQSDIDEYFAMREVPDPSEYDILRVESFFDFMREISDIGFIGVLFFKHYPILFGNYISDIDINLPSFAYTYNEEFIGASGLLSQPKTFARWKNYFKTDKMLRRFVGFRSGIPFDLSQDLYTIVHSNKKYYTKFMAGGKTYDIKYCNFTDASPLHGPYTSYGGAYCIFTSENYALTYLSENELVDKTNVKVEKLNKESFFEIMSQISMLNDIGINPGNPRYMQGYCTYYQNQGWEITTLYGTYNLSESNYKLHDEEVKLISTNKSDTIEQENSSSFFYKGLSSTINNPLKNIVGSTKSSLPIRESAKLVQDFIKNNKDIDLFQEGLIESKDISIDSFAIFAFDKITGEPFMNNIDEVAPFIFSSIFDAIIFFYHQYLQIEYDLGLNGYTLCNINKRFKGSEDKILEDYIISERKIAMEELMNMILIEGYSINHAELLKSYINRSFISLEIEQCGYLGDLGMYNPDHMKTYYENHIFEEDEPSEGSIPVRIKTITKKYIDRLNSDIQLDEQYQKQIRISLGFTYNNFSIQSHLILESAIKEFESVEKKMNHDYAGITMKLCKVFERELNIIIFNKWRVELRTQFPKDYLNNELEKADNAKDLTLQKLLSFLLKKSKLELGSMQYAIKRVSENCNSDILNNLKEYILLLKNSDFILSEEFLEVCNLIMLRYRNGGVHEKIVTFEIAEEAFDKMLNPENNYFRQLANI